MGRRIRNRYSLPVFAFSAAIAFVIVSVVAPSPVAIASPGVYEWAPGEAQTLTVAADAAAVVVRDKYSISKKVAPAAPAAPAAFSAPASGIPDPGTAQAIGYQLALARGWGQDQFSCLVALFNRESHWNVYAANPSGAYGIPQALPGSKMASAGADWATNPATQITWGLNYIAARYGTPCGAWGHSQSLGWY
ncbi:MAG: aggregation-promoting factor C-terminal-like domain-containing protein [Lacisediminihabitans sp.]